MYPMLLRLGRRIDTLCETADLVDPRRTALAIDALAITLPPPAVPSWDAPTLGEFLTAAMPPAPPDAEPVQPEAPEDAEPPVAPDAQGEHNDQE